MDTIDTRAIAKAMVANNKALVKVVTNNPESYKPVRAIVDRNIMAIGKTYANGMYINGRDKHRLTWDIINEVNGDTNEVIEIV